MGRKKSGCFVFGGEEPRAVIASAPDHTPAPPPTATPALRGNMRQSETRESGLPGWQGTVDPLRARLAGTSSQVRFPLRRLRVARTVPRSPGLTVSRATDGRRAQR